MWIAFGSVYPIRIPQYSPEEIRAVTDEAARRGSYVAAHAYSPEAIRHSIDNGVRSIEHGNLLDAPTAAAMASAGAFLVPTLAAYDAMQRRGEQIGMPAVSRHKNQEVLESGQQAVELARAAGVSVGFGTDLMGPLEDEQLNGLRLQAGVDGIWTALASATSVNAELIGRPDLGTLAVGSPGDASVIAIEAGDFTYHDVLGEALPGRQKIVSRGIGQIPEGRMVFANLTVEENLRTGASQD